MIGGCCIYLGHYTDVYGHFLLETLSRFWIFDMNISYDKLVFQPWIVLAPITSSFAPSKTCFECFSIKYDKVLVIDRELRFENLLVPTKLVEIYNEANEEQVLIYRKIVEHCRLHGCLLKSSPSRIYLSRKDLGMPRKAGLRNFARNYIVMPKRVGLRNFAGFLWKTRRYWKSLNLGIIFAPNQAHRPIVNEDAIEKLFISFGFIVIYPEQTKFEEQVLMCSKADVMAGFSGSALHNSVFMKEGSLVITIGSLEEQSTNSRNQIICDSLSKVQSEFIRFKGRIVYERLGVREFDTHYLQRELEKLS